MIQRPSDNEIYSNEDFIDISTLASILGDTINPPTIDVVEDNNNDEFEDYSYVPEKVYPHLPSILQEASKIFIDRREKDIFLTGALSVLSGCFHNVRAYNCVDGISYAPNLFVFVVAPPASGKHAITYAKKLALQVVNTFKNAQKRERILFLPGNSSAAAIRIQLKENSGAGIMVESEIDTTANAKKQEWGDYTDMIRVAFENETYSYSRINGISEIQELKFSMALSGTPNQFKTFIDSAENGLFSRGCYYFFENNNFEYKPYGRLNVQTAIEKQFEKWASEINLCYQRLLKHEKVKINFSIKQLEKIKAAFKAEAEEIVDGDLRRNINRIFTIVLKIATVLTVLKINESDDEFPSEAPCDDNMLPLAIELGMTYLNHSYAANSLLSAKRTDTLSINECLVWGKLPEKFSRAEAIKLCKDLKLSDRTIDTSLRTLVRKNKIILVRHGHYENPTGKDNEVN